MKFSTRRSPAPGTGFSASADHDLHVAGAVIDARNRSRLKVGRYDFSRLGALQYQHRRIVAKLRAQTHQRIAA